MKTVILAGGFGTRLSEETGIRPKPMVEVGEMPILWHIMKSYSAHGFNDFIICCGYKGYMIKEYFRDYFLRRSDITVDLRNNSVEVHNVASEPWKITMVDTGENTMTGGRIKRIQKFIGNERFFLTYGDGLCDVDFNQLLDFHTSQNVYATLTATQPPGRFGAFSLESGSNLIENFREKPKGDGHDTAWVNGGFFVAEPEVFDYIEGDSTIWEREPLEKLARSNKLAAFRHRGFWQPMDTLRDKMVLEEILNSGKAPWKKW
jgi:glucose-1-phosphate cytidylyltransferase